MEFSYHGQCSPIFNAIQDSTGQLSHIQLISLLKSRKSYRRSHKIVLRRKAQILLKTRHGI